MLGKLREAFPVLSGDELVTEQQILDEPYPLMLVTEVDDFDVLPFYMQWCVKHPDHPATVPDGTLDAIATYGRSRNPKSAYSEFKPRCSEAQVHAIQTFLDWLGERAEFVDKKQLERALQNW